MRFLRALALRFGSLDVLLVALTLLGAAIWWTRPILDTDWWWHLTYAREILAGHGIEFPDPFSFTATGGPWLNHHWLSELIWYAAWSWGGHGLTTALTDLVGVAALAVALLPNLRRGPFLLRGLFFVILVWALQIGVVPRGHLFGYLCFALTWYALQRRWPLWRVALLFVVWANLHGSVTAGILLLGLWTLGAVIDRMRTGEDTSHAVEYGVTASVVALLAASLNPHGPLLLTYTLGFGNALYSGIQEWQSPDFRDLSYGGLALGIAALCASLVLGAHRMPLRNLVPTLAYLLATLYAVRNGPLFTLCVAATVPLVWDEVATRAPDLRRGTLHLALFGAMVVVGLAGIPIQWPARLAAQLARFPTDAALATLRPTDRVLNEYGWGGFLIEHGILVYVDGRAELYGAEKLKAFSALLEAKPGYAAALAQYGVTTLLLHPDQPLVWAVARAGCGDEVYRDAHTVVVRLRAGCALEPTAGTP